MKRTRASEARPADPDELRPEYELDYRKARPNRFAGRVDPGRLIVVLDPDVSKVFTTPASVNAALRALIEVVPGAAGKARSKS